MAWLSNPYVLGVAAHAGVPHKDEDSNGATNMTTKSERIDALRGATSDFREALETLQKSSNPKDIEHAETVLKHAGWKKGDNGEFTPPQSDHRSN